MTTESQIQNEIHNVDKVREMDEIYILGILY